MSALASSAIISLSESESGRKEVESENACKDPRTPGVTPVLLMEARKAYNRATERYNLGIAEEEPIVDEIYACFCMQQSMLDPTMIMPPFGGSPEKDLCAEWSRVEAMKVIMMIVGASGVIIINQFLIFVIARLVRWEKHHFVVQVTNSQFKKLFLAQFMNTALVVLLLHINLHGATDFIPGNDGETVSIGKGEYTDFELDWFLLVGSGLALTISLQTVSASLSPLALSMGLGPLLRSVFAKKKYTQNSLNELFTNPEWNLALRLAQTMNVIFCVLMYCSGMPILLWFGCFYCFAAYWVDKYTLLRGSRIPPAYTFVIVKVCCRLCYVAVVIHSFVAAWAFSTQEVFPSYWQDGTTDPIYEFGMDFTGERFNMKAKIKVLVDDYILGEGATPPTMTDALYTDVMDQSVGDYNMDTHLDHWIAGRFWEMAKQGPLWNLGMMALMFYFLACYIVVWLLRQIFDGPLHRMWVAYEDWKLGGKSLREQNKSLTDGMYADHKYEMIKARMVHAYEMKFNPRYHGAFLTLMDQQAHLGGKTDRIKSVGSMEENELSSAVGTSAKGLKRTKAESKNLEDPENNPAAQDATTGRLSAKTPEIIAELRNKNWEALGHHTTFVQALVPSRVPFAKNKRQAHTEARKELIRANHPLLTTHADKYDKPPKANSAAADGVFSTGGGSAVVPVDEEKYGAAYLATDINPRAKSKHMSQLMKTNTIFSPAGGDGIRAGFERKDSGSQSSATSSASQSSASLNSSGSSNWTEEEWVPVQDPKNKEEGKKRSSPFGNWMRHPFMGKSEKGSTTGSSE
jgi:hypothetical protein